MTPRGPDSLSEAIMPCLVARQLTGIGRPGEREAPSKGEWHCESELKLLLSAAKSMKKRAQKGSQRG